MYSKEQKATALAVFHQTNSVSEIINILGYSTKTQLYTWISTENMVKRERKQLSLFANPPEHPRNSPLDVKLDAIKRCFEQDENIIYGSEDIGYSRTSIYQWIKRYWKEGTLGLINHKNIRFQKLDQNIIQEKTSVSSSWEMEELKKQLTRKKRPRHRSGCFQQQGKSSDHRCPEE